MNTESPIITKLHLLFGGAVWGCLLLSGVSQMSVTEMLAGALVFLLCRGVGFFLKPKFRQIILIGGLLFLLFFNFEFIAVALFSLWFSDRISDAGIETIVPLALGILAGSLISDFQGRFFVCTLLMLLVQLGQNLWNIVPSAILILVLLPIYEGVFQGNSKNLQSVFYRDSDKNVLMNFILAYGAATPDAVDKDDTAEEKSIELTDITNNETEKEKTREEEEEAEAEAFCENSLSRPPKIMGDMRMPRERLSNSMATLFLEQIRTIPVPNGQMYDLFFMPDLESSGVRKMRVLVEQSLNKNGTVVIPAALTGSFPELKWFLFPDRKMALGFKDWSRTPDAADFEEKFFFSIADSQKLYLMYPWMCGDISGALLEYNWPRAENRYLNKRAAFLNKIYPSWLNGSVITVPALVLLFLVLTDFAAHRHPMATVKLTIFESACSAAWLCAVLFYSLRQELSAVFPPRIILGITCVFFIMKLKSTRRRRLTLGLLQVLLLMIYSYTGGKISGLLSLIFIGLSYAMEGTEFPRLTKWDTFIGLLGATGGVAMTCLMLHNGCNIYQMLWFGCVFRLWILLRN